MNFSSALVLFIISSDDLAMWSFANQKSAFDPPPDTDTSDPEDILDMSWQDLIAITAYPVKTRSFSVSTAIYEDDEWVIVK